MRSEPIKTIAVFLKMNNSIYPHINKTTAGNIENLKPVIERQSKDIARFSANDSLKEYDRGVAWTNEHLDLKGQMWKSAYLPVWLYSYQQVNGNHKMIHYVAVNARTKEVMGSVPIHMPILLGLSFLVEISSK